MTTERTRLFSRPSWTEAQFVTQALRTETVGGAILLAGALLALLWANSPWREGYTALRDAHLTIPLIGFDLDMSLGHWAADGLLAIFFFVAGLELKREFLVGDLNTASKAAVPVVAAFAGVATPAIFFAITVSALGGDSQALRGWAIPTATDIAFALAVLAVLGSHLPSALRSFLLTLAVVDDLIAITIIAIFYTENLVVGNLLLALIPLAAFAALTQRRIIIWWLLIPLAVLTWVLVYKSGVHATVAGVLLGLVVPVKPRASVPRISTLDRKTDVAHRFEYRMRPISAGFAVPLFAFFASGVTVIGGGLAAAFGDEVALGTIVGLVVGKVVGVLGATFLMSKLLGARLDDDLTWVDGLGVALLTGIGFTVSLLIGELAFGPGSARDDHVKIGVLAGSLTAAVLAGIVLRARNRIYKKIHELESRDDDGDGIPDCYENDDGGPSDGSATATGGTG